MKDKFGTKRSTDLDCALGEMLSGWTVEFHIVDARRPDGTFKIPFFSRITLRDEALALKSMSFDVAIKFIST